MLESWKQSFLDSLARSWGSAAELLPSLIGALLVLVAGYLVATLVRKLIVLVAGRIGLDRVSSKVGLAEALSTAGFRSTAPEILGTIVFWIVFLSSVVSSAETIGLRGLSQTVRVFVLYLPKLAAALLVLVLGLWLASFAKRIVSARFEAMGIQYSKGISGAVYGFIVLVIGTMAVSQLEIETDLFNQVILIGLITMGFGLALTIGLGTRGITKNLLAGMYAREQYRVGAVLHIDGQQGELCKVGAVTAEIETSDGERVHLPNSSLIESIVRVKEQVQ